MAVRVAHDVDVGGGHRLALANDLRARERVLGLAGGDVRDRPQLDDRAARAAKRVSPTHSSARRAASAALGRSVDAADRRAPRRRRARSARQPRAAAPPGTRATSAARTRLHRLLAEIVADAERVDAGLERAHRRFLDADGRADRLHLERVGEHEPVEAELVAEQALHDRAG